MDLLRHDENALAPATNNNERLPWETPTVEALDVAATRSGYTVPGDADTTLS